MVLLVRLMWQPWHFPATIGTTGFVVNAGAEGRDSDRQTADWVYHDPGALDALGRAQFDPPPGSATGSGVTVRAQSGYRFDT